MTAENLISIAFCTDAFDLFIIWSKSNVSACSPARRHLAMMQQLCNRKCTGIRKALLNLEDQVSYFELLHLSGAYSSHTEIGNNVVRIQANMQSLQQRDVEQNP